jgi:DNA-binding IclR family transcriptional regulator
VEVGARLLRALAASSGPMMLRDLAVTAGMPAARAHRYLASFGRAGLTDQLAESGHYDLGPFALELGLAALGRVEAVNLALPTLNALRDRLGQTVALAMWANKGATIVRWLGADAPVAASLRVGSVMPLTRSATGRVFAAFMPMTATSGLIRAELLRNRQRRQSPATRTALARELARTRRQGVACATNFIPGISGCAAPVFSHDGSLAGALVVLGYSATLKLKPGGRAVLALRTAARGLSGRLGYQDK